MLTYYNLNVSLFNAIIYQFQATFTKLLNQRRPIISMDPQLWIKQFATEMMADLNLMDTSSDDVKIKKVEPPSVDRRANFLLRAFGKGKPF